MNIRFTSCFAKSLKKLNRRNCFWHRVCTSIRCDIPAFFKNIWYFRKVLWHHRWWDYRFTLEALRTSLEIMESGMKNGLEVRETLDKKTEKMRRAIQILNNIEADNYIEMAEVELGALIMRQWEFKELEDGTYELIDTENEEEKAHNKKVYDRAHELETEEWDELWYILKGQNYSECSSDEDWNEKFDGSGLRGWWD